MKNLLLTVAMLSYCAAPIFAQTDLYVSPVDVATDSTFIFVNDRVLYVENGIELVRNTASTTTNSNIYLRNGAQLMQGSDVANTGNGRISIYQEAFGDAYDYTFWCSPVSNSVGTGNQVHGLGVIKDSIGGFTGAYEGLNYTAYENSSQITNFNGKSDPMAISTRWFYIWNPNNQSWVQGSVQAGMGFTMKGLNETDPTTSTLPGENHWQRYDFTGRANNGDFEVDIQRGPQPFSDGLSYYFAFAGNPYPSALNLYRVAMDPDNWEDPLDPATNKIDSFRFWEEDITINSHLYIDNQGGYATWIPGADEDDPGTYTQAMFLSYDSAGNPIGSTGTNGGNYERLNAPVGQGFMIVGTEDMSSTGDSRMDVIYIKNEHRRYIKEGAANNSQFRTTGGPSVGVDPGAQGGGTISTTSNKSMLRLHTYFNNGSHYRDMVLLFDSNSTDGYDGIKDASHPMDAVSADAYFTIGEGDNTKNLVIQSLPYTSHDKMIPISFRVTELMEINPVIAEEMNPPYGKAYLYDNQTGIYQELKTSSNASVGTAGQTSTNPLINSSAKITLEPGEYEGRFFITFRGDSKPNEDEDDAFKTAGFDNGSGRSSSSATTAAEVAAAVDFFQNNRLKQLEVMNPDRLEVQEVAIYDMTGKLVIARKGLGNDSSFTFPTHNFSDGVYLVLLTTTENVRIDYKINVFNK